VTPTAVFYVVISYAVQ